MDKDQIHYSGRASVLCPSLWPSLPGDALLPKPAPQPPTPMFLVLILDPLCIVLNDRIRGGRAGSLFPLLFGVSVTPAQVLLDRGGEARWISAEFSLVG